MAEGSQGPSDTPTLLPPIELGSPLVLQVSLVYNLILDYVRDL